MSRKLDRKLHLMHRAFESYDKKYNRILVVKKFPKDHLSRNVKWF